MWHKAADIKPDSERPVVSISYAGGNEYFLDVVQWDGYEWDEAFNISAHYVHWEVLYWTECHNVPDEIVQRIRSYSQSGNEPASNSASQG